MGITEYETVPSWDLTSTVLFTSKEQSLQKSERWQVIQIEMAGVSMLFNSKLGFEIQEHDDVMHDYNHGA